jgi:hypothetical protein
MNHDADLEVRGPMSQILVDSQIASREPALIAAVSAG